MSGLYLSDNVEIINRTVSAAQLGLIEIGSPIWLAEFVTFAAIGLPGYIVGGRIQKFSRKRIFPDREPLRKPIGAIMLGFTGFLLGIWINSERGYFDDSDHFPSLAKFLTDWLIFVGPVIVGVLSGNFLQRFLQK